MRIIPMLIFCCVLTLGSEASASGRTRDTVGDLYSQCKQYQKLSAGIPITELARSADVGYCLGFLNRFIDGLITMDTNHHLCVPLAFSSDLRINAFLGWADSHKNEWNEKEHLGVIKMLKETWPCPTR